MIPSQINSSLLCSEFQQDSGYEMQQTISFGKALEHQKTFHQAQIAIKNPSTNLRQNHSHKSISLKQIFQEYLNDPLSTYSLELSTKDVNHCRASKKINEKYGKYTTSISPEDFHHSLQNGLIQLKNSSSPKTKPKLPKISQILKMIEQNRKQRTLEKTNADTQELKIESKYCEIKIEDFQQLHFDKKPSKIEKQPERNESQVFLELQSKVSNKYESVTQKITLKNGKSDRKLIENEPLSPVPQNPERKILKIQNSHSKTVSTNEKLQGLVSGLEFSKKLRKKNPFNQKSCDPKIKPFDVFC